MADSNASTQRTPADMVLHNIKIAGIWLSGKQISAAEAKAIRVAADRLCADADSAVQSPQGKASSNG